MHGTYVILLPLFADVELLGWFAVGKTISSSHIEIHNSFVASLLFRDCRPLFLLMAPSPNVLLKPSLPYVCRACLSCYAFVARLEGSPAHFIRHDWRGHLAAVCILCAHRLPAHRPSGGESCTGPNRQVGALRRQKCGYTNAAVISVSIRF